MAAGIIPYFEDEMPLIGYCRSCKHRDCEEVRLLHLKVCRICGKGFTSGQAYFNDSKDDDKLVGIARNIVHADCLYGVDEI